MECVKGATQYDFKTMALAYDPDHRCVRERERKNGDKYLLRNMSSRVIFRFVRVVTKRKNEIKKTCRKRRIEGQEKGKEKGIEGEREGKRNGNRREEKGIEKGREREERVRAKARER